TGELARFDRNGHSFAIKSLNLFNYLKRDHGWRPAEFGTLVLLQDGVEVPCQEYSKFFAKSQGANKVKVAGKQALSASPATVQYKEDVTVSEWDEIIGTEDYPIDNRFGDQACTTVRQVSRESTNELSVDTTGSLGVKLGHDFYKIVMAELEAKVSRQ